MSNIWANLLTILVGGLLVNNFVMNRFLGCCPFLGVSKRIDSALGMGMATTFVIVLTGAGSAFSAGGNVKDMAAGVGLPTWSATTLRLSRSLARRRMVLTKLPPRAPNTQLVRKITDFPPTARIASSPASLLRP